MLQVRYAFKRSDTPGPDPDVMKLTKQASRHPEQEVYPGEYNVERPYPKTYYDKKPYKMLLEAGKLYSWCSCGLSKSMVTKRNSCHLISIANSERFY